MIKLAHELNVKISDLRLKCQVSKSRRRVKKINKYLKSKEYKDSEIKNIGLITYSPLTENKKKLLEELIGSASSKQIDFNKVRDEYTK